MRRMPLRLLNLLFLVIWIVGLPLVAEGFATVKNSGLTVIPSSSRIPVINAVATPSIDGGMNPSFTGEDEKNAVVPESSGSPISVAGATFGLVKAMIGAGLLALSSGLAAVTDYPAGLYPAHALMVILGVVSAYTFSLYGRLTHATKARTLGDIWKRLYSDGVSSDTDESKKSDLAVSYVSFMFCFGSCVAYSLTICDMFSRFVQGIALPLPSWALSRQASILAITSVAVLPLCRLSSLASLAPVSIIGVVGKIFTIAFLAIRCPAVVAGSPYSTIGKGMLSQVTVQPSFSTYIRLRSPAPLILIAMACVAFMAHFSAPDFYHALSTTKTKDEQNATSISDDNDPTIMQRFNQMTVAGYITVMILNALALTFGFLTFGGGSNGIILNNYNNADWGARISRLLVGISIIGSYPFVMSSCRAAALEIFSSQPSKHQKPFLSEVSRERRMTSILLTVVTAISLIVKDAGFVIGLTGAVMGSTIAFTFPALLYLKMNEAKRLSHKSIGRLLQAELWLCRSLVGFGILSAFVGGTTTVIGYFFPHLLT